MILVGEDGERDTRLAHGVEHVDDAGVGRGVVLFVLAVVGAKLCQGGLEHHSVAGILRGHEALDQLEHAVADLVAVLVDGEGGPSVQLAGMVAGKGEILQCVEDGAVQVKDYVLEFHSTPVGYLRRIARGGAGDGGSAPFAGSAAA